MECLKEWHAYKVGAACMHTHTWCLMSGQLCHLQSSRHQEHTMDLLPPDCNSLAALTSHGQCQQCSSLLLAVGVTD